MDITFISIHDLSQDARVRYASDSIEYILGYLPHEVVNKSCWEYFHPEEVPFARTIHGRGVQLDKAAVLKYCRIRHKNGLWISCECVFSVVYDVMIASTSIYRHGMSSQKRAADAPIVRRLFTSSPRDPRYHMLTYISSRFSQLPRTLGHEPRAALFLNRFTRTLTVMFATNGVTEILGVSPRQLVSRSFYFCIQEDCLKDAVHCLESAKANNSIAYLRFWYRDPLQDDAAARIGVDTITTGRPNAQQSSNRTEVQNPSPMVEPLPVTDLQTTPDTGLDQGEAPAAAPIEVEAVVSCTSDGLVVVLRRARPPIPQHIQETREGPVYANGLFASPWAAHPILPKPQSMLPLTSWGDNHPTALPPNPNIYPGYNHAYAISAVPNLISTPPSAAASNNLLDRGAYSQNFLDTIRDVAVFAWGVIGINGSLEQYRRGTPMGESLPADGVQIWDPLSALKGTRQADGNGKLKPVQMKEDKDKDGGDDEKEIKVEDRVRKSSPQTN